MARTGDQLSKKLIRLADANDETSTSIPVKKGRNARLVIERDMQLLHRYYYYTYILQLKQEKVIVALQKEFFLSDRHMLNIVYGRTMELKQLFLNKPSTKFLRKQFPHFTWD